MIDEVRVCVEAKINWFNEYFETSNAKTEVHEYFKRVIALGEGSKNAVEFEERHQNELAGDMAMLMQKCPPRSRPMTSDEKKQSIDMAKKMMFGGSDNKTVAKGIAKEVASHVAGQAITEAEQELISKNRERMIEDGTFRDYNVATNHTNTIKRAGKLFGKILKKE